MTRKTGILLGLFVLGVVVCGVSLLYPAYKEHLKWSNYFRRTRLGEPNLLVVEVFNALKDKNPAQVKVLDLGAGNGSDSLYLLNKGYQVYAVDFMRNQ